MSLAQWGIDRGLLDEADELYRRFLLHHPADEQVHAALTSLRPVGRLDSQSEPYLAARRLLPSSFAPHETSRFIVLSDSDRAWSRSQAEHLERAFHQFLRFADRLQLRPLPIRHKLVCVLFHERDDYQTFAELHDGVTDPSIAGYYSPKSDRIVFYNPQNNPSVGRAHDTLSRLRGEVEELRRDLARAERRGAVENASSIRQTLSYRERHLKREHERVAEFIDQTSVATTIHEAMHQLLFHTQVQTPYVQYPIWVCEGMATAFETDRPNTAFGPDHDFAPRRDRFESLLKEGKLLSVEALVQVTILPTRADEIADAVYHQSCALVSWMSRFRRTELADYLMRMRQRKHGRPSPKEHLASFTESFGDPARLERAWLRYEEDRASIALRARTPIDLQQIDDDAATVSTVLTR